MGGGGCEETYMNDTKGSRRISRWPKRCGRAAWAAIVLAAALYPLNYFGRVFGRYENLSWAMRWDFALQDGRVLWYWQPLTKAANRESFEVLFQHRYESMVKGSVFFHARLWIDWGAPPGGAKWVASPYWILGVPSAAYLAARRMRRRRDAGLCPECRYELVQRDGSRAMCPECGYGSGAA